MKLGELLETLPPEREVSSLRGPSAADPRSTPVRGLCMDSRRVAPGDLFVALRGAQSDGHDHLEQALALGAAALLVEEAPDELDLGGAALAVVDDTRRALAPLSAHFFGHPSHEVDLVGITGTNGKTSTSYLVESILAAAGRATGLIGTVEVRFAGERLRAINTTPESLELQQLLRTMRNHRIDSVVMEVSSHALAIGRTDGCRYRVAAFTNLTQDHLDFHHTMDRYCEAKLHLFRELLASDGVAVIHLDDPYAARFVAAARHSGAEPLGVARGKRADARLWLEASEATLRETRATVAWGGRRVEVECPLLGDFNLDNLLVACGIAEALGISRDDAARGIAACPQVPGRMERVDEPGTAGPTVLVDYAHTPDAVEKLLAAVRPLSTGSLITVFGCGGDRDRKKRAPMAEAVARHSDRAIATSDNPRSEDPEQILADVERGLASMRRVGAEDLAGSEGAYVSCVDRRDAIELAVSIAGPDDTVVIAGKGHEDYQIIGRERLPFDDRREARRALERAVEGS